MSEWQPIESAPMDGRLVVVTGKNRGRDGNGFHYCIASFQDGEWHENFCPSYDGETVLEYLTGWMPLPPPPST